MPTFNCDHEKTPKNSIIFTNRGKKYISCRLCKNLYSNAWSKKQSKTFHSKKARIKKYGKNALIHFSSQLFKQKSKCGICEKELVKPHQDHNHNCCDYKISPAGNKRTYSCGKCLRGLLCPGCNLMLSGIENKDWLTKAQAYLKKWSEN